MKKEAILKLLSGIIALLFFYAAVSKLVDFEKSKHEMLNQVFSQDIALLLVWLVPVIELGIVGLLLVNAARLKGFYAALILLCVFSIYIAVTMTGAFGRIPCSCGGILNHMGYWTHLIFNLLFIGFAMLGIALQSGWITNRVVNFFKRKEVFHT
ncbi:Methylamine utilisation protein MauE [Pedobacter sp. ok626]|uniref:MauE/DoxX family redox-associated membrane protein n=1 Tax=Pedobacter sp. ok626 TaxID=1761882 RepID=UPI00088C4787|nr:MauE/DoxX family redox-associated membrane protein [Pedobacter sp. ok626]SDL11367.1 Methylamine utilisation protein MauE [Pedobacter sp. ok626]